MSPIDKKVTIQINMNDQVWVKLTDFGRTYLKHQSYLWPTLPAEDENGWSKWQVWALMSTFGRTFGNGNPVPFETTIRVETTEADVVVGLISS